MYNAPSTYWENVWEPSRNVSIRVVVNGTVSGSAPVTLNEENIKSFRFDERMSNDTQFQIGNAIMRTFNVSFFDENSAARSVGLGGATADVYFGVNADEIYYGRFYIDEVDVDGIVVHCECVDAMAYADIPYTTTAAFPMSLYMFAQSAANVAGLTLTNTSLTNGNIQVSQAPENITCREALQFVAQISGTNAKMQRNVSKNLEFVTYTQTDQTVPISAEFKVEKAEDPIQITGISFEEMYLVGTNDYALLITNNPILERLTQEQIEAALNNILSVLNGIQYYPSRISMSSNAAFETGDIITATAQDGTTFTTIISSISQSGLSQMDIVGAGETKEKNRYVLKGRLSARVTEILSKVEEINTEKLPALSQAIVDATEKISNAMSGYIYIPEENDPYGLASGQILIMDAPIPTNAANVWRWNLSGLAHSSTGVNGTYTTAITQDGQIVANFITAGIMNASVIQAGILSSQDGSSWLNLDDGTFNFGNGALSFDGTTFSLIANDIQTVDEEGNTSTVATEQGVSDAIAPIQQDVDSLNEAMDVQNGFITITPSIPEIKLGKTGQSGGVSVTGDKVKITGSDNAEAILESSKLTTAQVQAENVGIGSFMWVHRSANNHLSLKWVGD